MFYYDVDSIIKIFCWRKQSTSHVHARTFNEFKKNSKSHKIVRFRCTLNKRCWITEEKVKREYSYLIFQPHKHRKWHWTGTCTRSRFPLVDNFVDASVLFTSDLSFVKRIDAKARTKLGHWGPSKRVLTNGCFIRLSILTQPLNSYSSIQLIHVCLLYTSPSPRDA